MKHLNYRFCALLMLISTTSLRAQEKARIDNLVIYLEPIIPPKQIPTSSLEKGSTLANVSPTFHLLQSSFFISNISSTKIIRIVVGTELNNMAVIDDKITVESEWQDNVQVFLLKSTAGEIRCKALDGRVALNYILEPEKQKTAKTFKIITTDDQNKQVLMVHRTIN